MRLVNSAGLTVGQATMDISALDHANACFPVSAVVEQRCDLGHWHELSRNDIPPWGRANEPH